jgi:hypothetical protein
MFQANLASRMGASVSTVRRLKDEHRGPSMAQLMRQASKFELTVEQALTVVRQFVEAAEKWRAVGDITHPRICTQCLARKLH